MDDAIRIMLERWMTKAERDLRMAKKVLDDIPPITDGACFHAQQCAEKCLKAVLVFHNEDFPYTHNVRRLLKLCGKYATWPQDLKDAEELTPYSITTRYPGEDKEVSEAEATSAIEIARQVRDRVRTELKLLGMELTE